MNEINGLEGERGVNRRVVPTIPIFFWVGIGCDECMYLRYTTVRKDGKVHRYWRLVRNVRVGRRVIHQTVAQRGELDTRGHLLDDGKRDLTVPVRLKGVRSWNAHASSATCTWRWRCGAVAACLSVREASAVWQGGVSAVFPAHFRASNRPTGLGLTAWAPE